MATDFSNKIAILSDLWINYREEDQLEDFILYNDIGLPLAYCVSSELATVDDKGIMYIEETFNLLCAALELDIEGTYESLNEMFKLSDEK